MLNKISRRAVIRNAAVMAASLIGIDVTIAAVRSQMVYKGATAEVPLDVLDQFPPQQRTILMRLLDQGREPSTNTIELSRSIDISVNNLVEGVRNGSVIIFFHEFDASNENSVELMRSIEVFGNNFPPPLQLYLHQYNDPPQNLVDTNQIPVVEIIEENVSCYDSKSGCWERQSFAIINFNATTESADNPPECLFPVNTVLYKEGSLSEPIHSDNNVVPTEFAIREYLINELFVPEGRNYIKTGHTL